MSIKRVIAITGCDSGLGWATAARSAREGFITVAGMHDGTDTEAAHALKKLCAYPCPLDVADMNSISGFKEHVMAILKDSPDHRLYALVNNAGMMIIGNYEWQTLQMVEHTINVNLLGAMRVVSAFLPDLRKSAIESRHQGLTKPRIINIASHCGVQPLPSFGPYSASKAGLLAFTQSLRMENLEYGLPAISYLPGGFIGSSKLISNQVKYGQAMLEHLNDEQRILFENKIRNLIDYLQLASSEARFDSLKEETVLETFIRILNEENPKNLYKAESWRYKFYYNLFKLPFNEITKRWIIKRFLKFPLN